MKRFTLLSVLFAVAIVLAASSNDTGDTKETRINYEVSVVQTSTGVEFFTVVDLLYERELTDNIYVAVQPIYTDIVIESEDKPPKTEYQKSLTKTSPSNKVNLLTNDRFRWYCKYSNRTV